MYVSTYQYLAMVKNGNPRYPASKMFCNETFTKNVYIKSIP